MSGLVPSTKIARQIKIRGKANPYDDQYTDYFQKRRCFAWRVRNAGVTSQPGATYRRRKQTRTIGERGGPFGA